MTEVRPIADSNKVVFYPQTHYQAVKGFDTGVSAAVKASSTDFFDLLKPNIETWHDELKPTAIKLQSPNGTVFLLSIDNDGNVLTTKEGDSNVDTISN